MSGESDRFALSADQYLAKYHVLTYLQDAVSQLLEHKEENPRVIPARFLSDYFKSVVQGNHTLFREYSYIQKTPHNKASFIQVFWKCFRHIAKNGDLLSAKEYHSLICLLCPDFPLEPVQKTARIILMEDAIDCLMSFADFLYAFQTQFFYEGPPQHKSQIPVASNTTHDEGLGNSIDGVDARSFLEAVLQILHTSNNAFSCPPADVIKDLLSCVDRVTFYGFLISLAKHEGVNASIGTLPDKSAIMEETDQELSSQAPRPKSCRPKSGMTGAVKKGL
ncbi:centriolar satellite-associated tubulin polyglutamylase complex regulator 1-like isoform X2 [Montipora foliosa]|uniref:centriolar satellite-associated tubulin polyglutamylase complex regulator 1-like isoform X2 n=1 Tax=Montipora foliosa TaxID=591990 RepID=UPI0035F1DBB5